MYELFDSFVHHLLLRELDKRGRSKDFPIAVRRRFNASLAWWLWERGAASATTLNDIPQSLCDQAARDIQHSLDREEMRRELIQGCLIEKGPQTIYFHRSIQEFLAAEHLIETDLLRAGGGPGWLTDVTTAITPEIIDFVVAGSLTTQVRRDRAIRWFDHLADARSPRVPLSGFDLFVRLGRELNLNLPPLPDSTWLIWLAFFLRTGARDFSHRGRNTFNVLADLLLAARDAPQELQAAVLYALARTLFHSEPVAKGSPAIALASLLPVERLKAAVEGASGKKSERQIVRHDADFLFWSVLRSWSIGQDKSGVQTITIDLIKLHHDAMGVMPDGFASDGGDAARTIALPVQALYVALTNRKPEVSARDIEEIRPFFNNPDVRKLISPVEIVYRSAAQPRATREPKPKLGLPRGE